jgi:hypothetical protein
MSTPSPNFDVHGFCEPHQNLRDGYQCVSALKIPEIWLWNLRGDVIYTSLDANPPAESAPTAQEEIDAVFGSGIPTEPCPTLAYPRAAESGSVLRILHPKVAGHRAMKDASIAAIGKEPIVSVIGGQATEALTATSTTSVASVSSVSIVPTTSAPTGTVPSPSTVAVVPPPEDTTVVDHRCDVRICRRALNGFDPVHVHGNDHVWFGYAVHASGRSSALIVVVSREPSCSQTGKKHRFPS